MIHALSDYEYIADQISNISRIPIRLYQNGDLEFFKNTSNFPIDPALPYLDSFHNTDQELCYFVSEVGHFYGLIRRDSNVLILGPCYHMAPDRRLIRSYMESLNLKENYRKYFDDLLGSLIPMPLEMFLHLLGLVYFYITDKRTDLSKIPTLTLRREEIKNISTSEDMVSKGFVDSSKIIQTSAGEIDLQNSHTTYHFEQRMLTLIAEGDLSSLEKLFSETSAGKAGQLAGTYLRQIKNTFIASATLVSRAAIQGGMPVEEALTLSDEYVQHSENHLEADMILNLQYHMVLDFTARVQAINNGKHLDLFLRKIISYVREHITENISIANIAEAMGYTESTISKRFSKQMGTSLSSYIRKQKLLTAANLLKNSNQPIAEISSALGYSSQGHFQNLFKKEFGVTPKKYRENTVD